MRWTSLFSFLLAFLLLKKVSFKTLKNESNSQARVRVRVRVRIRIRVRVKVMVRVRE